MPISASGIPDVRKRLATIQERMVKDGVRKAVRAGAEVFKAAMLERAPVRIDERTPGSKSLEPGALKRDIKVRMNGLSASIGPGKKTRYVGRLVEYGHQLVKKKKVIGTVSARPWARPAFEASAADAVEAFRKEAKEQIESGG